MFVRNAWYVAAWEREIGDGLVPLTVLGLPVVLFRQPDGAVVALEDACPHRKLPLSMGRLVGAEVECGYHGMRFDGQGACTWAPGSRVPPAGARVRRYPVVSRYGLLWIWMGDAALADPSQIFEVAHWGDPAWGLNAGGSMEVACHVLYITDNLLDPSHVAWVHRGSFAGGACEDTPLQVTTAADGVTVWRWMQDVEPAPFYAPFLQFTGRCDRKQQYEVRFPSHAAIRAIFTPAGTGGEDQPLHPQAFIMDSYNLMTPINEHRTRYFWFQMRNFAPGDEEVSRRFDASVRAAFEEDRVILEAVHRGIANERAPHLNLPIDAGPLRFRRRVAEMIEAERAGLGSAVTAAAPAQGCAEGEATHVH